MITIKDVAAEAGVSTATVSRVMNSPESVSDSTIRKVKEAITTLGYSTPLSNRTLKQERQRMIAIILPDLTEFGYTEMLQGAIDIIDSEEFLPIICTSDRISSNAESILSKVRTHGIAGALVYDLPNTVQEHYSDFPVWSLNGNETCHFGTFLSKTDLAKTAIHHFCSNKRQKILYLADSQLDANGTFRHALRSESEKAGIECRFHTIGRTAADAARMIWDINAPEFDAIITQYSAQAIGIVNRLRHGNISIPHDLELITLENSSANLLSAPPITALGCSSYQIGMIGAKGLINIINDPQNSPTQLNLPSITPICHRGTTLYD